MEIHKKLTQLKPPSGVFLSPLVTTGVGKWILEIPKCIVEKCMVECMSYFSKFIPLKCNKVYKSKL